MMFCGPGMAGTILSQPGSETWKFSVCTLSHGCRCNSEKSRPSGRHLLWGGQSTSTRNEAWPGKTEKQMHGSWRKVTWESNYLRQAHFLRKSVLVFWFYLFVSFYLTPKAQWGSDRQQKCPLEEKIHMICKNNCLVFESYFKPGENHGPCPFLLVTCCVMPGILYNCSVLAVKQYLSKPSAAWIQRMWAVDPVSLGKLTPEGNDKVESKSPPSPVCVAIGRDEYPKFFSKESHLLFENLSVQGHPTNSFQHQTFMLNLLPANHCTGPRRRNKVGTQRWWSRKIGALPSTWWGQWVLPYSPPARRYCHHKNI